MNDPAATFPGDAPPLQRLGDKVLAVLHRFGPFLIVAAVIAVRFPPTLWRAEFWAEDATEFFFDAVSLGAKSLVVPVYGYHFFVERVIAYVATFLPVYYTPYVYAWASLVIDAAALAYLVRDGFSWIAPRRGQRVLLAALLAVGPGTAEVLLNMANLPAALAFLGLLLLIERPFLIGPGKLILLVIIIASSGQMVLWIPVVAYLAWATKARTYWIVAISIAVFAVLNGIGNHEASSSAGILDYGALSVVPRILLENSFTRLLPGPFLGALTGLLMRSSAVVFWGAAIVGLGAFAALAYRASLADRDGTAVLVLGYLGAIGMLGLTAISRAYSVPLLVRESGSLLYHLRYAFLPSAIATLIWASFLLRPRADPVWRRVRIIASVIIAINLAVCFSLRFARADLHWPARSGRVQWLLDLNRRNGQPVVIRIEDLPVHPFRWVPANGRVAVVVPGR